MKPTSKFSTIIIRYAEIGLKGKNRWQFETRLIENIRQAIGSQTGRLVNERGQILLHLEDKNIPNVTNRLKHIFGISWFAPSITTPSDKDKIIQAALICADQIHPDNTFAIRAHRTDKQLPFTSHDLEVHIGSLVNQQTQAKVNLDHPDHTIYIDSNSPTTYVYCQKIPGIGGLPVGSSGKVLCLLSGGFDSITAAYMLAKRGAQVDFLHFHIFPDSQRVVGTKISTIAEVLSAYTQSSNLYLTSNLPYQMAVLNLNPVLEKQELIVFRRLMARVGEKLAQKFGYQALVFGDSLGQVASQTLENIALVENAISIPIFRPVIGFDKEEIILTVKGLNLEETTNQRYQDCCSMVASHPTTKGNLSKIQTIEKEINIEKLVEDLVNATEKVRIQNSDRDRENG